MVAGPSSSTTGMPQCSPSGGAARRGRRKTRSSSTWAEASAADSCSAGASTAAVAAVSPARSGTSPPTWKASCALRSRGCLETVFGDRLLQQLAAVHGRELTHADVVELGRAGDPAVLRILRESASRLVSGLYNAVSLLVPERVVLSGPLAQVGDPLLGPILRCCTISGQRVRVVLRVARSCWASSDWRRRRSAALALSAPESLNSKVDD